MSKLPDHLNDPDRWLRAIESGLRECRLQVKNLEECFKYLKACLRPEETADREQREREQGEPDNGD